MSLWVDIYVLTMTLSYITFQSSSLNMTTFVCVPFHLVEHQEKCCGT